MAWVRSSASGLHGEIHELRHGLADLQGSGRQERGLADVGRGIIEPGKDSSLISGGGAFFAFKLKRAAARTTAEGLSRKPARSLRGRKPSRASDGRARATRASGAFGS